MADLIQLSVFGFAFCIVGVYTLFQGIYFRSEAFDIREATSILLSVYGIGTVSVATVVFVFESASVLLVVWLGLSMLFVVLLGLSERRNPI